MANNLHLYLAVKAGDLVEVQRLLSQGHNIGKVNPKTGMNSLHLAVLTGNYDIVELLSRDEVHINSTCSFPATYCEGYTPLHLSVELCNKDITKLLLSRKADVNKQDDWGNTALHVAGRSGFILINEINSNFRNVNLGSSFIIAHLIKKRPTKNEYCDIANFLLQSGANVQLVNNLNKTVLHVACELENDNMARIILKKCSSIVNNKNKYGCTALHIAVRICFRNWELVKLLIENNADVNATDNSGSTPLYFACVQRKLDVVKILVENGCDTNLGGVLSHKPIDIAVQNCDEKILKLLLEHGGKTSQAVFTFINILPHIKLYNSKIYLFESNRIDFFKANMDIFGDYENCLNISASISYFEIFRLLLRHGCFKNIERKKLFFIYKQKIITHFVKCVINLKTLGCFSARDYPDIDASNIDLQPDEEIYAENCKKEVLILRGIFVCSGISLLDFLKKDLNKMVRLLKNQEIVNVLQFLNCKNLPMYGDLTKTFFKLAMYRRSMLNRSYECFNDIFCQFPKLPDMIVETIFDFFTTYDLKIFLTT